MPYTIDFLDDRVLAWELTVDGASATEVTDYAPTVYAAAHGEGSLADLRDAATAHPAVGRTAVERWRTGFRADHTAVLRLDVERIDDVRPVARWVRRRGRPGAYRPYNVDFTREFRYCLERGASPRPARPLETLALAVEPPDLAEPPVAAVRVDGDRIEGAPETVAAAVDRRVAGVDPDVLVLSSGEVVPALYETAREAGVDLQLGREPGWQRLAGASTYESYGRVGHSPARYNVPGRVLVDRSNSFFLSKTNLAGCVDLVERSRKPLQELAWASIGNVLTAIQVREALDREVLVPWNSWRHECFKPVTTLDRADRGGFTFSPDVGLHEDVHELDFSSLYPNVIRTRNLSPETVRCDCHPDREDVPGLGYNVCPDPGYLPEVLAPLVEDRDDCKEALRTTDDPDRRAVLEGRSDALKWILVACFGYQGFSNAKFGRIECHEAINAYAREILLDAKEVLEAGGWRVVHGIVDSLWVTADERREQTPLSELADRITDDAGIRLEYEAAYDWIAFVPRRERDSGALTKYFGRVAGEGAYKYRGIETRQRSTADFVADAQEALIATLDRTRSPEAVCDRLRGFLARLERGAVDPERLLVERRTSKERDQYRQYTRTVAALERAADLGVDAAPGQSVAYVVVDDAKASRERVRLAYEPLEDYDADFYADRLLRAAESVLSPLGWRQADIEAYLASARDATLAAFE